MARPTRVRKSGSQAQQSPNTTKKWKKKVHRVEAGDIVQFHTNNIHQFGTVGTVIGYISPHEVLIRTFGGSDSDYPSMCISVYDREPNRHFPGVNGEEGATLWHHSCWIQTVVHRINPQPQVKRKKAPVKFLRVHPESLPDVLSGEVPVDRGVHVVVDENAPAVPEQIVAQP